MPIYKSILFLCLSLWYVTVSAQQSVDHNFEETLPVILYLLQDDCHHGIDYGETKTVTFTPNCINETNAPKIYVQYYRFIVPADNNNYVLNVKVAQGNTFEDIVINIPFFNDSDCVIAQNNLTEKIKSKHQRQDTIDTKTYHLKPETTSKLNEVIVSVPCHNPGPVDLHIFSQDVDAVLQLSLTHYQP